MAAVVLDCRKALVITEWAICLPFCTKGHLKRSSYLVGAPFLALWTFFSVWTSIRWLRALSTGVRKFKSAERLWGFEPMNTSQILIPLKAAGSLVEEQHTI